MKRLLGLVLAGLLVLGVFSTPAAADDTVKVWTQNLYIGADLTPVIEATTPGDFYTAATGVLQQMGANLFPIRAQRLASEIALYEPDVIALQEVENIMVNGNNAGPPFVDYLAALQNALTLRGQHYDVVAVVVNLDLEVSLPFDITGDAENDTVRVVDRDVILVRWDVTLNNILDFGCARTSADGCNYSFFAPVPSPFPPPAPETINIERGYVGVDVTVRGKRFFFVTTHLEQRVLRFNHPEDAAVQSQQAGELVGVLGDQSNDNPGVPIILAGDFNSSPKDETISIPPYIIVPPYKIITGDEGGFTDSWTKNPLSILDPKGLTCCQDEDLRNRTSHLYERIDIVFIRNARFTPWEFVTTKVPLIFPEPHWASDHGGVFAKLVFKSGN